MLTVGLTGGIGSGKSTVARLLADRGAIVIDADMLARDAIAAGTPGFTAVRERFGDDVLTADGALDRGALAAIVFADDDSRRDLEGIVHPQVRRGITQVIADHAGTEDVVVVESPLLIETGSHHGMTVLVVVTAKAETQIARLVERGMGEDDARARMAAQLPLDDKVALADIVVDNEGSVADLEAQVDRVWAELMEMRP